MNYDKTKYRKIDWKHFMMFHWIINPGLFFNELILGQRIPQVMLIERDKSTGKSWLERSKVPCPHCNTIHHGQTWSNQNKTAFKNWFGLYCPKCGGIIPCLVNITSFIILVITAPVWYWYKDKWKAQWLAKQPERFAHLDFSTPELPKYKWISTGAIWGLFMFAFNEYSVLFNNDPVNYKKLVFSFAWWLFWGIFGFGWVMHQVAKFMLPKKEKVNEE